MQSVEESQQRILCDVERIIGVPGDLQGEQVGRAAETAGKRLSGLRLPGLGSKDKRLIGRVGFRGGGAVGQEDQVGVHTLSYGAGR